MHPKVKRALRAAKGRYADGGSVDERVRAYLRDVKKKHHPNMIGGVGLPASEREYLYPDDTREPTWIERALASPQGQALGFVANFVGPGRPMRTYRGYHGTSDANYFVTKELVPNVMWMTGDRSQVSQAAANSYAARNYSGNPTAVLATEARFSNPKIVDAQGADFGSIPYGKTGPGQKHDRLVTSDQLAREVAAAGHDGLVLENVRDFISAHSNTPPTRVVAALRPNTVFDDYGRPIFSLGATGAGLGVLANTEREK